MPLPDRFAAKAGNFIRASDVGGQSITGVGFRPKAVILFQAGNTGEDEWQGQGTGADKLGIAFSVFTSEDGVSLFETSEDDTTDTGKAVGGFHRGVAHRIADSDGVLHSRATLASMDDDGFTLNWTTAASPATIIGYLALGGEGLLANLTRWQLPTTNGVLDHAVTGVGFEPDVVLHLFLWEQAETDWDNTDFTLDGFTSFNLGAMDAAGRQWALGVSGLGEIPAVTARGYSEDFCLIGVSAPAASIVGLRPRASFVSMDPDGFTVRLQRHAATSAWVASLSLAGIQAHVGAFTAAGTSQEITGVGFTPRGVLLAGVMEPAPLAPPEMVEDLRLAIGAATADDEQAAASHVDLHDESPTISEKLTRIDDWCYHLREDEATAALQTLNPDGFTLSWSPAPNGERVAFIALGSLPIDRLHVVELELDGPGGGWTDVTDDVLLDSPGIDLDYGISGSGPLDLVASTGRMKFGLRNYRERALARAERPPILGIYSPGHPNCTPGFEKGIRVRYTYLLSVDDGYGKFIGRIREIVPATGVHRDRKTIVTAVDWMNEAAITKFNLATQIGQTADAVLEAVVETVPRQPEEIDFDAADSTFPFALDNSRSEGTVVLTEIQRICQSEYGRCYVRGGLNYWGRLRFEKRTARAVPVPVEVFDGTMQGLDAGDETSKTRNRAVVTAHPRRVDSGDTSVLAAKPSQNNPLIPAGGTLRMSLRYVDAANPDARIGGTDFQTVTATTDYLMNSAANGSGSNRTANFTVNVFAGANQADFEIINNSGTDPAYVTKLQIRGRGLKDFDPIECVESDDDSIADIGESKITLDMPYQGDAVVAREIALFLVATWSTPGINEASVKYIPRTDLERDEAMALDVGDAISVIEELSGVLGVYFIQSVGIRISGDAVTFNWGLQRAQVADYWLLGEAGFSELGVTTVLGPL